MLYASKSVLCLGKINTVPLVYIWIEQDIYFGKKKHQQLTARNTKTITTTAFFSQYDLYIIS